MVLMKKGEDTRYVADIFIPHYLGKGYEVIFPKKTAKAPVKVVDKIIEDEKPDDSGKKTTETVPSVISEPAEAKAAEPTVAADDSEPTVDRADSDVEKPDETSRAEETSPDKKQLACPICGKQYAKKAYLLKHIEKEHPDD